MHKLVATCFVALTMSGCMLGPDYRRPPVEAPKSFRFADAEAKDLANTAWWEQFQDPALNELIRTALAENKDVQIAAARIEEFLGRLATTRSQLFPQVGADANASRQQLSRRAGLVGVPPNTDATLSLYQLTLSASWEIDVWGRVRRLTEAARADLLATEEGRRATILTLVTSVASSYVNLLELDRQLAVVRATAISRRESLRIFDLRFRNGTISELELAQSRSEYEAAVAAIPPLENAIAQQENALSVLLGRNPGPIARSNEISRLPLPGVPEGLPSQLLERRPDLRQAELTLAAANARIGAARALYFPTISLTGLLGTVSTQLAGLFSAASHTWAYAADAAAPIFTAGRIDGLVKQAEAQQQQALLGYQKAIQTSFREVEDSLISHNKTRQQLIAQTRQVDALRRYAQLARLRYDGGYTSYIEVLDAERSLFNVEQTYVQTQGAVFTTLVDVYKAIGGGWVITA
ncbi:MAG: efflux transporter outer membrane subunit, partial [Thermoanaerobaculia bacterium]